ncbi:mitofusin [Branchiostoma belcheri]|nr:mitofusin [Branchiostoma belcheri]
MDEQDKKKLVHNQVAIVESLLVEDVRRFLIARKVFTSDQFQQIIGQERTRIHKAEELLDLLPTRGPKAFQEFRKALQQCNYSFLDSLLEKGAPDSKAQYTERHQIIPESLPDSLIKSLTEENAKLRAELKILKEKNPHLADLLPDGPLSDQTPSHICASCKDCIKQLQLQLKKVDDELRELKEKQSVKPPSHISTCISCRASVIIDAAIKRNATDKNQVGANACTTCPKRKSNYATAQYDHYSKRKHTSYTRDNMYAHKSTPPSNSTECAIVCVVWVISDPASIQKACRSGPRGKSP